MHFNVDLCYMMTICIDPNVTEFFEITRPKGVSVYKHEHKAIRDTSRVPKRSPIPVLT